MLRGAFKLRLTPEIEAGDLPARVLLVEDGVIGSYGPAAGQDIRKLDAAVANGTLWRSAGRLPSSTPGSCRLACTVDARVAPILIAYDGSELARAAVQHAGELFPGRPALVATVWEPGLATMTISPPDDLGVGVPTPDRATIEAVDRAEREHASTIAVQGAELARAAGLAAEPYAVPDELDVVTTLIEIAHERDAAAVVVGSHGISGLRSRFLGGVSRKLVEHCDLPVLVIRASRPD